MTAPHHLSSSVLTGYQGVPCCGTRKRRNGGGLVGRHGDTVGSGSSASLRSAATRRTAHGIWTAAWALLGLAALTCPAATMALERVGAVALESGESRKAASLPAQLNLAVIRSAALDAAPEYHIDSDFLLEV